MKANNEVQLIGNAGLDVQVINTENNTKVAKLSIATHDVFKNKKGERVQSTEWHQVVFFNSLAELAEKYIKKGDNVLIKGSLKTRKFTDKNNIERYSTEIIASDVFFLNNKK